MVRLRSIVLLAALSASLTARAQPAPAPAPTGTAAPAAAGTEAAPEASPAASPEDPRRMREARDHYEAGRHHYDAHEYREAVREFDLSNSLVPSADLAYNIARCFEQLDELDTAVDYYERYLHEKIDPPDKEEVQGKIAWLKEQIESRRRARHGHTATEGLLRLAVLPLGATIAIDGRSVGVAPKPEPLKLSPGRHRLTVRAPGRQDWVSRIEIRSGDTTHAVADLPPETVHSSVLSGRLWTFVAGGAAAAAAIGGVILGIGAQGTMNEAQSTLDGGDPVRAHQLARDARAEADRADYLYGGALLLGVTAAVLYFVEGSSVATESRPAGSSASATPSASIGVGSP